MNNNKAICLIALAATWSAFHIEGSEYISPEDSVTYLRIATSETKPWHEPDSSLRSVNIGLCGQDGHKMISIIGENLVGKHPSIALDRDYTKTMIPKRLEALYRSGGHPDITNILHTALLAPTNYCRDATFHAYVMASPVPMTALAETVVKHFPAEQRQKWYITALRLSFNPSYHWDARHIDKPSREALRFAHFLHVVKPMEPDTDLRWNIGETFDPERKNLEESK